MRDKLFKKVLIFTLVFVGVIGFCGIYELEVKAESNGWINIDNSWRYYSGPVIKTGWTQYNGNWYYLDDNGMIKTGWIKIEGKWYYLDPTSGKMITGWVENNKDWYYLDSSGEMKIGWIKENGNLYYLNNSGVMVKDIYVGSYYLDPHGVRKK